MVYNIPCHARSPGLVRSFRGQDDRFGTLYTMPLVPASAGLRRALLGYGKTCLQVAQAFLQDVRGMCVAFEEA